MSVFARAVHKLFLVVICCGIAFADARTTRESFTPEPRENSAPAQAEPENGPLIPVQPQIGSDFLNATEERPFGWQEPLQEPFNLPATMVSAGEVTAKWSELQPRILADMKTIAACKSGNSICPPAARLFLSIVDLGRQRQGRVRLAWINRAVNLSVRPMSDWAQYGYADYWASPLQTLGSRAGDCEDYAIVKYLILRELGNNPDELRLMIVRDGARQTDHAVVAVRDEGDWLILDNRTMATIDAEQDRQYQPLFVMDDRGVRTFSTAAIRR